MLMKTGSSQGVTRQGLLLRTLPVGVALVAAIGIAQVHLTGTSILPWTGLVAMLAAALAMALFSVRQPGPVVILSLFALGFSVRALYSHITDGWIEGQVPALIGLAAASTLLIAVTLLLYVALRSPRLRSMLLLSAGILVITLGFTGFASDLFPGLLRESPPLTNSLIRAGLILALGASLVHWVLLHAREGARAAMRRWMFVPLALALVGGTLVLSHLLRTQELRTVVEVTDNQVSQVAEHLDSVLGGSVVGLDRMAQAWAWRGQPDQNDWNTDAWLFVDHYPEVHAVAWVDADFHVRWLTPLSGNESLQNLDLTDSIAMHSALLRAFETRRVAMTQPLRLQVDGEWGFHVYAPIRAGQGVDGYIAGFYRIAPVLDDVVTTVAPGFVIRVIEGEEEIYRSAGRVDDTVRAERTVVFRHHGAVWQIVAAPKSDTVNHLVSPLPAVTLGFGLLMAFLVAIAVYQAEVNRTAARRLVREVRRRSQSEAALRRSQHDLELRVAARTADLNQKQRELERTNARLEEMATTDPLTGLANRRYFLELAEKAFHGAGRYDRPLSLIMLDLDDFKGINDTHGHKAGDDVLEAVAEACASALRESDILSRYGGEEFVILLPETDEPEAQQVAERLRQSIEAVRVHCGDDLLYITASLGVTARHPNDRTVENLLVRADRALYQAKEHGRNRVVRVDGHE